MGLGKSARCAFAGLMLAGSSAFAQTPTPAEMPSVSPAIAAQYTHPHDLIDVGGGRKMNLFCMGQGGHPVIFEAGGNDWSFIWALVQPAIAAQTRACSYDRAGMGYSDPSDLPRTPVAIVEDLHALIHAAKIDTPVMLVGHSLGGFNMKLYAALYPEDVAGLVLIEPSEERTYARMRDAVSAKYGAAAAAKLELLDFTYNAQAAAHYKDCAVSARDHDLDPASDAYKKCADGPHAEFGPEIAAAQQKVQMKRVYQDTQAAELVDGIYGDPRADNAYAKLFTGHVLGDKPLLVLTSSWTILNPLNAAAYSVWVGVHEQTAALSSRGVNRIVPDTHHSLQVYRPQIVIDAIREVLGEIASK